MLTVTVRLGTAVETGVTLAFTSLDTTAATLTAVSIPATLTTTTQEAVVRLFAVDDSVDTPLNRVYGLRMAVTSGPDAFIGLTQSVEGSLTDDDVANLVLAPNTPTLSDLAEGATSMVMVKLATQPLTQRRDRGGCIQRRKRVDGVSPPNLCSRPPTGARRGPSTLSGVADRSWLTEPRQWR